MKKLIFGTCLLISAFGANAQRGLKFGVGADIAAITGNLNTIYSLAAGVSLQADLRIDADAALTGNIGLDDFVGKKIGSTNTRYVSAVAVPLLIGVKYYFIPKVYGSAQLGETFFSTKNTGSKFTYAPGIGIKIDEKLDLLAKYTGFSGSGGTAGIRLGYTF